MGEQTRSIFPLRQFIQKLGGVKVKKGSQMRGSA